MDVVECEKRKHRVKSKCPVSHGKYLREFHLDIPELGVACWRWIYSLTAPLSSQSLDRWRWQSPHTTVCLKGMFWSLWGLCCLWGTDQVSWPLGSQSTSFITVAGESFIFMLSIRGLTKFLHRTRPFLTKEYWKSPHNEKERGTQNKAQPVKSNTSHCTNKMPCCPYCFHTSTGQR